MHDKTDETEAQRMARFRAQARQAPDAPGVYVMRSSDKTILYVGKAKILKNRLLSYFSGKKDIKTRHLVSRIDEIEWTLAGSEYDALLLENNLIKEHKPKYNISLKDGRTYPSIRITKEEYPRVFRTRRIISDGSEYFGPFPSAETIDTYLELIKELFPLRRCATMRKRESPCMYYHIGRCPGPCAGKISHEAYMDRIRHIRKLLAGETDELLADLRSRMDFAASEFRFEEAARLRDAIRAVEQFVGRSKVQDFDPAARDYIAWHSEGELISFVLFSMRDGRMVGRDSFMNPLYSTEEEALQSFLMGYYDEGRMPPPLIYLKKTGGTGAVRQYFRKNMNTRTVFLMPREPRHAAVINLCTQNAKEEIIKRRREIGDAQALLELKKVLGLSSLPLRIEGFDIAHLSGKNTVASLISFKNGLPDKKNYRHFRIRSLAGGIDDFAAMREAVARRYTRLVNEESELPDLVLVDGGAGQVSAAKEILDELGLDCDIAGLAKKNEEVYRPDGKEPLVLPKDSSALRVLVAIRDETHRFATGLSQKLRNQDLRFSVLESVSGIGKVKAKALMKTFGSLEGIAHAPLESISKAAKISIETARLVQAKALSPPGDFRD
jgi:excinuclease ABC subunit C